VNWASRLGWAALAIATLAVAVGIFLVRLPEPDAAVSIDTAVYQANDGTDVDIALPYAAFPSLGRKSDKVRYVAHFDLAALPDDSQFLLIPTVNRRLSLRINGETVFDSDARSLWSGPLVGASVLVPLSRSLVVAGRNKVVVVLDVGRFAVPIYLSRIYIGTEAALAPTFKLRVFLEERLKTMALAAHVLLGIGIICAYFYRPRDPLFSYLAAMVAVSFVLSVGMFAGFQSEMQNILPYIGTLAPTLGLLSVAVAFALIGKPPPRIIPVLSVGFPCVMALAFIAGMAPARILLLLISGPVLVTAFVSSAGIVAWGALRNGGVDARLMLAPFFLTCAFLIRDIWIVVSLPEHPFVLFTPYVRPMFHAFLIVVLMRRLARSLDDLDRSNENLNVKLAQRESELALMHREDRIEAARLVREQERQRLTRDLHDGISGHLVSIIAMTERAGGDVKSIEQAAREALDDLRLVIYSLELGDRELPLALANFRERLIPQLQRTGVDLDWSTANLPEVTGVTPANALIVLRILQEAITNALKHGPARKIKIRGANADDMVAITVENDGCLFAEGNNGHGLENMRRRAGQLRGCIYVRPLEHGAELKLLLPRSLPDVDVNAY